MNIGRIFVTIAAILSTMAVMACSNKGSQKADQKKADRLKQKQALLAEGEALLAQTDTQRKELEEAPFKMLIRDAPVANPVATNVTLDHKTIGLQYNWERLSLAERQTAKEKLASVMTGLTRILEIDAKKGVYITQVNKIKDRKAAVESYQVSLGNYELQNGESANPTTAGQGKIFKNF